MANITSFEEIESWIISRELVKEVYLLSNSTDLRKDYSLKDQMQRAAVSIMSNIAEGYERGNRKEFIYFLRIARGSCAELRSQLYIALDVGYIDHNHFTKLSVKAKSITKSLSGFISYLEGCK